MQFTDTASAGNGGVATASANGGAVSAGDINSGGNVCNAIGIGNTYNDPQVYGGDCLNTTALGITVDGGTAIADASGGNYNLAFVSQRSRRGACPRSGWTEATYPMKHSQHESDPFPRAR